MNKKVKFCPSCSITGNNTIGLQECCGEQDNELISFNKGFLNIEKGEHENQYTICPYCNTPTQDSPITEEEFEIIDEASNSNRQFLEAMIKLKETDIIEYESRMSQFRSQVHQQKVAEKQESSKPKLTCPKCGSSEVTEGTRGFTLTTGFLGSGNFRYVCKRCGNKWKPGSMLETLQRANNNHWDD